VTGGGSSGLVTSDPPALPGNLWLPNPLDLAASGSHPGVTIISRQAQDQSDAAAGRI